MRSITWVTAGCDVETDGGTTPVPSE